MNIKNGKPSLNNNNGWHGIAWQKCVCLFRHHHKFVFHSVSIFDIAATTVTTTTLTP
jgi:hypothetical protein